MSAQVVCEIAMASFGDAIDMLSIMETLEAGNAPASVAAVNSARTDAVAKCVYRALWSRLVVIVARAYAYRGRQSPALDPVHPGDDGRAGEGIPIQSFRPDQGLAKG
jgi:hypothetical protein